MVSPEQLYEQWSVLDLLHNSKKSTETCEVKWKGKLENWAQICFVLLASLPKPSVDISCYDVPPEHEKQKKLNGRLIESEFSGEAHSNQDFW